MVAMVKILDIIDIVNDLLLVDDVNVGLNDILDNLDKEEKIIDDVNRVIDFDHSYQTKQLIKLINGSYDKGRFQEQYLFWLPASKMASGSLIPCFLLSRCNFGYFGAP